MKQRIQVAFLRKSKETVFTVSRAVCPIVQAIVGEPTEILAYSEDDKDKVMVYQVDSDIPLDIFKLEQFLDEEMGLPDVRVTRMDIPKGE